MNPLLSQHKAVFKTGLDTLVGATPKVYVMPNAKLKYFKARPLPYALKDKVETNEIRK